MADYEGTVTQFRDLVLSLQRSACPFGNHHLKRVTYAVCTRSFSDLENLREHQASRETESQSLTSQSQAMLNLNLKLKSSVLKGQVKTIDLELRKLDAQQALTHLAITKVSSHLGWPLGRYRLMRGCAHYSRTCSRHFSSSTAPPWRRCCFSSDLRTRPTS